MSSPTVDETTPAPRHRDPHVLMALGSFAAMVALAVGIIIALVSIGRLLHAAL